MLARVFGCCRVVFNDAVRLRTEAYQSGIKLSDSEIQRRVITCAKNTSERAWLSEVPSVALVQSVNDSRRAWRNFFDACTGKRRGPTYGSASNEIEERPSSVVSIDPKRIQPST
ncbi:helix-turn-helix domain-containing protein [Mycobacterium neglectum]|uniref:helix-turn-helix domain-containing protein n=1 Tax=Mycobacterium neglectum TaxID=242737 RepID=UPI001FE57088|nr:helix-turn-helix domain-containing protein [Mycobacterium neglectum]